MFVFILPFIFKSVTICFDVFLIKYIIYQYYHIILEAVCQFFLTKYFSVEVAAIVFRNIEYTFSTNSKTSGGRT